MADGRMIKREISDSEKLGKQLKGKNKARVLYFMILPHLDVKGRLKANPRHIKGRIITELEYSADTVQKCLEQLHNVGLIILYNSNNEQYLEYTRFKDFQTINPDREAKSKIPDPTLDNSRTTPENSLLSLSLSLSKEKLSKDICLDCVLLTKIEHQKLIDKFGEESTKEKIKALNDYVMSKGTKYKSHYHTILNWARRESTNQSSRAKRKSAKELEAEYERQRSGGKR